MNDAMAGSKAMAALPAVAKKAFAAAAREKLAGPRQRLYCQALGAVGWPEGNVYPLPNQLTKEQRAVAEVLDGIDNELGFPHYAMPSYRWQRRRWLGIEGGGGELARLVHGVPMWRRLQEARTNKRATHKLVDALPMARRLALYGEILVEGTTNTYDLDDDFFEPERLFGKLRAEGKSWAPAFADRLLAIAGRIDTSLRYLVFLALVRAKVPIEPRWDVLLPVGNDDKRMIECARALPEPRRAMAASAALANDSSGYTIDYGLALLAAFPSKELTEGIWTIGENGRLPVSELVKALKKRGEKHPVVATTLAALLGGAPAAPKLRCISLVAVASAAKLTPLQRTQIERAGKAYDGRRLRADEWLTKEKPGKEPTFAGRIELAAIADADGRTLYDVYEYMGDSGTVFKAKTTKVVCEIIQGGFQADDAGVAEAIRAALHEHRTAKTPRARR
jgi:hypothetical protein